MRLIYMMNNSMKLSLATFAGLAWCRRGALIAALVLFAGAVGSARGEESSNGVMVTVPNGYANIEIDDLWLQTTAGEVRWTRRWDGQEWKFNPQWESLSQSWRNLTGSQTADTTGGTTTVVSGSGGRTLSSSSDGGGGSAGCWVWVDEDWQPSTGTVLTGGMPAAGPMVPVRTTPFNRVMGEDAADYPPLQRVSIDYAGLCMGTSIGSSGVQDAEGIRRINELYVGDEGRYAFNNRSVLEKRTVRQLPAGQADALYASLATGHIALAPETNAKGFRWIDRAGDWIDYNTQGQVVAWGDRNDNTVWLVRDAGGIVRGVADANGRVLYTLHYTGELVTEMRDYPVGGLGQDLPARSIKYEYDAKNRLTQVTDARGHPTRYDYDTANRIVTITDAEGRVEQLAYSGDTVTRRTTPDGAVTDYLFEFDDTNKQFISKTTGPETAAGRRVEDLTHNRVGKLVRQIVNGRTEVEVRYDTGARVEVSTNARGFTTRTTTNEFDQIVGIDYPDGATFRRQYSALHLRMTERTDEAGYRTQYAYDTKGNLLKKTEAVGTPDERATEYARNGLGQIERLTRKGRAEANGTLTPDASWQFEYDAQGQLSKSIDPEGHTRRYVHDRAGHLVAYTDPRGNTTRYEVDAQGNLTKMVDPLGHAVSYAYDKVGNHVGYTSARGKTTLLAYDAMNRNERITSPSGGVYRLQYNGQGLPIAEIDEDGRESRVEYDNFQRLSRQIDGKGNVTEHDYQLADGSGTGALGSLLLPTQTKYPTFSEQQRFDERERSTLRTVLNPTAGGTEGLVSSSKYDKRGLVSESTNAEGKTSYFAYDAFRRTTRFTNSLGKSVELSWDVRGNLIQVKDYNGNATRFEYDRANRLVNETLPLGQTTRYTYDAKGNRETVTDPAGHTIRYVYDAADRPVRSEVTTAGQAAPGLVYTFTHDEDGNLAGWSDGTRSAIYTYDADGRQLTETLSYGGGVSLSYAYTYTAGGYTKSLRYPDGTTVAYSHDAHGQLGTVEIPGEGSISVNTWNWVAPKQITLPGGTTSEFSHDGLLKLTGLKVRNPGQQTVFEIANRYGKLEEIEQKALTDSSGSASSTVTTQYGYDEERRLRQATRDSGGPFGTSTETFAVDPAGNRTSHSAVSGPWIYDANNRLTQRGDTRYEYDGSGNLILRTAGTSGAANTITRFNYDALNRLVEVQDGAGALIARYAYDPFDNRLVKDLYRDDGGNPLATARRTHYLYGSEGLIAEADGTGAVTVQYGWKPDGGWSTDPVFIKTAITNDGAASTGYAYFHNDHLGTPLRATDKAGQVVWRAEYDSSGRATPAADNALQSNLRLAGQYHDAETGLHHNTRRYYDPAAGRYITADPIGLAGGWNLYEYANSDPANQLDPTGEWVWVVINVAMTVYDVYTTYQEYKETGCFDWSVLIPTPKLIPRTKWVKKVVKKCSNPCECMAGGGGGSHANSFPGDTPVHALDDRGQPALRPIASLKPGDKVLAKSEWKPEAESLSYEPVIDVLTTPNQQRTLVHLTLEDGRTITATDGHPFKTTEGWRDAILLKRGGKLLLKGEGEEQARDVAIVKVQIDQQTLTTYNLEVANAHTFFVGDQGALAHNGRPPNLSPPGAGRRGAFRKAKRNCGIPVCQQPDAVSPNTDRRGKRQAGRIYSFGNCDIRDDAGGHDFGEGNDQNRGPHFNDSDGGHYDY